MTPQTDVPKGVKPARGEERGRADRPVSMRDLADRLGVSIATVSMALSGSSRISDATRTRVLQVAEELGYRPNANAQSLAGKFTRVLAVLLPALRHTLADAYFGEVLSGVCDRAGKLGHKVLLEQAKPDYVKERRHLQLFDQRAVDGALLLGFSDRHHFLEQFADRRRPVVAINSRFDGVDLDHVCCDYRDGAEQAVAYLLQLGHRKVGLVHGGFEVMTAREVRDAWKDALLRNGVEPDASWMEDGRFTIEGGGAAVERLRWRHPDMTAVLCGNDKMAEGVVDRLTRLGLQLPADLSVIGCDDLPNAGLIKPRLTTVHTPLYELGALACERLVERIRGRGERVAETLRTHLVLRESTALAPTLAHRPPEVTASA